MRLNFRTIGKVGFLLAIMGFFMPVACDMNAFQIIEHVDATSTALILGLFAFAIIGLVLGAILLKKSIPVFVDWVVILGSIITGLVLLSRNEMELQYGAYVIKSGFAVALLTQIISAVKREK